MYGIELTIDMHDCNPKMFTQHKIKKYMIDLCKKIDMKREDLHFWDYGDSPEERKLAPPHLAGVSACQFIETSNILIHTLDKLKQVYITIFSCKEFKVYDAVALTIEYYQAGQCNYWHAIRGEF